MGESWGQQRNVFDAPGEGPRVFFTGNLEPPGAHVLEKMIVGLAAARVQFSIERGLEISRDPRSTENASFSKVCTPPRPRWYVAKLENLEKVRGQGCPTRCGYEGYVAKRRKGQRVEG